MTEQQPEEEPLVYPTIIPLDFGHAWLRHMPLDSAGGDAVVSRVQVLSITMEDPAWPPTS